MRRADFHYDLPSDLIAQRPAPARSASRLLHLHGPSGATRDLAFLDLPSLLRRGDLLVFNDTRVIPARIVGTKPTGGQVEILLERVLGERGMHPATGRSVRARAERGAVAVLRTVRRDAATAVHRTRERRDRREPLSNDLCARTGCRGRADRRTAFRRARVGSMRIDGGA